MRHGLIAASLFGLACAPAAPKDELPTATGSLVSRDLVTGESWNEPAPKEGREGDPASSRVDAGAHADAGDLGGWQ